MSRARWHFQEARLPGTWEGFRKSLEIDVRNAAASGESDRLARDVRRMSRRMTWHGQRAKPRLAYLWLRELLGKDD